MQRAEEKRVDRRGDIDVIALLHRGEHIAAAEQLLRAGLDTDASKGRKQIQRPEDAARKVQIAVEPGREDAQRVHAEAHQQPQAEKLPGVAAAAVRAHMTEGAEDRPLAQQRIEQHEQVNADKGQVHKQKQRSAVGNVESSGKHGGADFAQKLAERHQSQRDQANGPDHVADFFAGLCRGGRDPFERLGGLVLFVHHKLLDSQFL